MKFLKKLDAVALVKFVKSYSQGQTAIKFIMRMIIIYFSSCIN